MLVEHDTHFNTTTLRDFYPYCIDLLPLPGNVPEELVAEFREAEACAANSAYRGAIALLRSALEKTLKTNGYTDQTMDKENRRKNLFQRIDLACKDGVISEARADAAQSVVRALGNDILHDEWREVEQEEYEDSRKYVQRILEDFYDRRQPVEKLLKQKKRL